MTTEKIDLKVICTQENLKNALQIASRVISSNNTLPILNNILLETENGQLKISSTNLEIAISTTTRCKVEFEGKLCAPAKILTDLVNSLPNENITLEQIGGELSIKTEHYKTNIKTLPSEDFPLIPAIEKPKNLSFDGQEFKKSLERVVFAASTSETQPEISGIFFGIENSLAKFVATDRYRLSEQTLDLNGAGDLKGLIIPQRAALELIRILSAQKGAVEISISENQVAAKIGETLLVSRLIDGQYPDYKQIIPNNFNAIITTDRHELANALKTSGIFSRVSNSVKLFYSSVSNKIKISSVSQDLGESEIELPCEIKGTSGEGEVIFNHRYILDALNAMEKEKVVLKIVNDSSPVILQQEGDESYMSLVMPIKL